MSDIQEVAKRTVCDVLAKVSPQRADNRNDWITAGMAIHKVLKGSHEGLAIWTEWSRQSPKFTEGECERAWFGFNADKDGGVNLGTLRMWAKEDDTNGPSLTPHYEEDCTKVTAADIKDMDHRLKVGFGIVTMVKPAIGLNTLIAKCSGNAVARWFYHDADGKEVLCVVRYQEETGKKTYRQFRKGGDGWVAEGLEAGCPLYNLPAILSRPDEVVLVCEGEKAADAAASLGLLATTSCQGASSAGKSDWSPLAGREVWICPDNDDAGESYARNVGRLLLGASAGTRIRFVKPAGLPLKGDLYDYVQQGRTRQELEDLANQTPYLDPADIIGGPVITCMASVAPTQVQWLWKDRVPLGRLTMIVGRPSGGKTFMTSGDWAARVTTGRKWPDGETCEQGDVLIISAEDNPSDTLRPRFDAHGGDPSRAHILSMVKRPRSDGTVEERGFSLEDTKALESVLSGLPNCKMVIIDPVGSVMGKETDSYKDNEVRAILAPVARLAEKYNVAMIVVMHRKKESGNHADSLALGSVAFTGIARVVWHVCVDSDDKERRLLLQGKNNLAKEGKGMAFRIAGEPPALVWEELEIDMDANDAVSQEQGRSKGTTPRQDEVEEWLRCLLAEGPVAAKDIRAEAKEAGFCWRTVESTVERMRIKRYKPGFAGGWVWELVNRRPECGAPKETEQ